MDPEHLKANKANWDNRARLHAEAGYGIPRLLEQPDALSDVDDESDSAMSEDAPLSEEESASAVVAVVPEAPYGSHDTGACTARPH